jgi:hypothetical protein
MNDMTVDWSITDTQQANRKRIVNILRAIPEERHSQYYFFASQPGENGIYAECHFEPGYAVCAAGAVLVALDITNFDQLRPLGQDDGGWVQHVVGPALGISASALFRIDQYNWKHTFDEIADWMERELFAGGYDESWHDEHFVLPDTFELP